MARASVPPHRKSIAESVVVCSGEHLSGQPGRHLQGVGTVVVLGHRYRLFAISRGEQEPAWEQPVPLEVRAMILAGDLLFLAGPPASQAPGIWPHDESRPGRLVIALENGRIVSMEAE